MIRVAPDATALTLSRAAWHKKAIAALHETCDREGTGPIIDILEWLSGAASFQVLQKKWCLVSQSDKEEHWLSWSIVKRHSSTWALTAVNEAWVEGGVQSAQLHRSGISVSG